MLGSASTVGEILEIFIYGSCDLRKERFVGRIYIAYTRIQEVLGFVMQQTQVFRIPYERLMVHASCLESFEISGSRYDIFLTPMVVSLLQQQTRLNWACQSARNEADLQVFLDFLGLK